LNILLTGATGFLGSALAHRLIADGHEVYAWVRSLNKAKSILDSRVHSVRALEDIRDFEINAVINLAGEPIIGKRWSQLRKQVLLSSRIDTTQQLVDFFKSQQKQPAVVLSGSAVGYYGSQDWNIILDESAKAIPGFGHTLCEQWEKAALQFVSGSTRVCLLRTGIVLGKGGGALKKMLLPFRLGLGGPIGNGQQVMSWIHLRDWIDACLFLLNREEHSGPFNLVSPNPVNNQTFSQALAMALHRPAIIRVPCFLLKTIMGESADMLCKGQRVIPDKLLYAGFKFHYKDINWALADII